MNRGKLPVTVIPAVSAVLLAAAAVTVLVPGGIIGVVLTVLLGMVGAAGLVLWWRVLRNPQVMLQKLMERRELLEEKAGRGKPQDFQRPHQQVDATEQELQMAIDAATDMLGGNRAARRAAQTAARKAVRVTGTGSGGRVTPKKPRPAGK